MIRIKKGFKLFKSFQAQLIMFVLMLLESLKTA